MSSFGTRLALSSILLGISEITVAATMSCPGAVKISHSQDYLVNLRSVIESDCLQDLSKNEELLSKAFATPDVRVTYRDSEKINYTVTIWKNDGGDKKSLVINITLHTGAIGNKKMIVDAYIPESTAIAHDAFLNLWTVTRQPSLRSLHLPPNLNSYRYTLLGRHPGMVAITTNENNLLTYLSYEEKYWR